MEKELSSLRKAMNSSTHKGIHFTEIQKKKIRASLHQNEITMSRKPKLAIYLITALAASLFLLLFYTDLLANFSSDGDVNQGGRQTLESEWKVRDKYTRNGKVLFSVYPDPTLSAGTPYGYMFSFNEPFDTYKGKEMEIYALHRETGERINVLPSEKITEPSSGYSSLGRFTTALTVPEGGLWKYEIYFDKNFYGDVVLSVAEGTSVLPEGIPSFVKTSDFDRIDWNRKAVDLGNNIIGNPDKSGVIGADMPSININQKWMWHLWDIENSAGTALTVVGIHRETGTAYQLLTAGWTIGLGGENNGADAHAPSSVNIPSAGEWAILLYVNEDLFDVLVYNIND
jgi:hypothetical protein